MRRATLRQPSRKLKNHHTTSATSPRSRIALRQSIIALASPGSHRYSLLAIADNDCESIGTNPYL